MLTQQLITREIVKRNGNEHGMQNYRCTVACLKKRELFCDPYHTYQPSGKWSLVTIPSIEFYYFDDGETVLRAYRDSGEAKASSASWRVFSKFLLKYKQSGTIARQKTRAGSSSLHDTQGLSFIVFRRDILLPRK